MVGDGRDAGRDRARLTQLATGAGDAGVRIDTLGYAPGDTRWPLRALGELAKRSLGTFRWVRGAKIESWEPALAQLRDEIARQLVVTWHVADATAAGQRVHVATTRPVAVTSNDVVVIGQASAPAAADDGEIPWLWGVGAVVIALATSGFLVARRKRTRPRRPRPRRR